MNRCHGFTLIELMIVVAVIAVLSVIALPLYRDYLQTSANGACLQEASAYISTAIGDLAADRLPPPFARNACASGPSAQPTTAYYNSDLSITFTPPVRGNPALLRVVVCQVGTRPCWLRE